MRYTREDVQTHNNGGCGGPYYPAVNVKHYGNLFPLVGRVEEFFECGETRAEEAIETAIECARDNFWNFDGAQMIADEILGPGMKIYSAGRSGGWLIVTNLPEVETWDAIMLAKWRRFENSIREECKFRLSEDVLFEDIESNGWAGEPPVRFREINAGGQE